MNVEGDNSELLFVISTSQVATPAGARSLVGQPQRRVGSISEKRVREEDGDGGESSDGNERASTRPEREKTEAAHESRTTRRSYNGRSGRTSLCTVFLESHHGNHAPAIITTFPPADPKSKWRPGAPVSYDFIDMMEGDGEEVGFGFGSQHIGDGEYEGEGDDATRCEQEEDVTGGEDSFDGIEETELEATQAETAGSKHSNHSLKTNLSLMLVDSAILLAVIPVAVTVSDNFSLSVHLPSVSLRLSNHSL